MSSPRPSVSLWELSGERECYSIFTCLSHALDRSWLRVGKTRGGAGEWRIAFKSAFGETGLGEPLEIGMDAERWDEGREWRGHGYGSDMDVLGTG